jgi:hypothetical protein
VNEPVLIVRPDDGPIGQKHVALFVLLMIIIDVLDENVNTVFKQFISVRPIQKEGLDKRIQNMSILYNSVNIHYNTL